MVIALSGGVDSAVLAAVLGRSGNTLTDRVFAITVTSDMAFARDVHAAERVAKSASLDHILLPVPLLHDERISNNGPDRCYWCKRAMFTAMRHRFGDRAVIMDGTNAEDNPERPGIRASRELGIHSPLAGCGLGKEHVLEMASRFVSPSRNNPPDSCRATRIMTGNPLSPQLLAMVEDLENRVIAAGFHNVRLRVDELMITIRYSQNGEGISDSLRSCAHGLAAAHGDRQVVFSPWEPCHA